MALLPDRTERGPERPTALTPARPRILLTTEGTYPYVMGGVSSWCNVLVNGLTEFDWQVLPIVPPDGRARAFELPDHAREVGRIEVWSEALPQRGRPQPFQRRGAEQLPAILARNLLGWYGDPDVRGRRLGVVSPLPRRRAFSVFRSRRGWTAFLAGLREVLDERIPEAGTPPALDLVEAA